MKSFWNDFRAFILRGNVVDLAVAFILAAAFSAIVKSLVSDIIMPPIGLALGNVDFANLFAVLKEGATPGPYASLVAAKEAGAITINYGVFIDFVVTFLIVAFVLFVLIRVMANMKRKEEAPPPEPTTKACPFCLSTIAIKASRCPNCTSQLEAPQ